MLLDQLLVPFVYLALSGLVPFDQLQLKLDLLKLGHEKWYAYSLTYCKLIHILFGA